MTRYTRALREPGKLTCKNAMGDLYQCAEALSGKFGKCSTKWQPGSALECPSLPR